MAEEIARLIYLYTSTTWLASERHILWVVAIATLFSHICWSYSRCISHIINVATQSVIGAYSKAKFFTGDDPTAHEIDAIDVVAGERDVISLIRRITAKVLVQLVSTSRYVTDSTIFSHEAQQSEKRFGKRSRLRLVLPFYVCWLTWWCGGHLHT